MSTGLVSDYWIMYGLLNTQISHEEELISRNFRLSNDM